MINDTIGACSWMQPYQELQFFCSFAPRNAPQLLKWTLVNLLTTQHLEPVGTSSNSWKMELLELM